MNNIFVISACQRSGTTLLSLMLSMHEEIVMIDEKNYDSNLWQQYQNDPAYGPNLVLKLPAESHHLQFLIEEKEAKVIWIERNPMDVIYSMSQLIIPWKLRKKRWYKMFTELKNVGRFVPPTLNYNWMEHPYGGKTEIDSLSRLESLQDIYKSLSLTYSKMLNEKPQFKTELFGALIWMMKKGCKDQLLCSYENHTHVLTYEDLIQDSKNKMKQLLSFMNLPFSELVLQHHQYLTGVSIGNTRNDLPILKENKNKYTSKWSEEKISTIRQFLNAHG